jgi:CheY-like chemotaxis protein
MVQRILEGEGCAVRTADEGTAALREARRGGVDLILLDVLMPRPSGFELSQQLKLNSATAEIPN